MIYDRLAVSLLSMLSTEREGSANATIARYLIEHAGSLSNVGVKTLAEACNVGTGSISRFCRDAGYSSFEDLRMALEERDRRFERPRASHAEIVGTSLQQVEETLDRKLLGLLVDDLIKYEHVFVCGMLKAQAAAVDLQVDLLMLGKCVDTCVSYAEQLSRIAKARHDELVVVFSYTGSYFSASDLSSAFGRLDRPRIWVVAGARVPQPHYVYGCLPFESNMGQLTHPFQLEMAAAMISQEYASRCGI